MLERTSPPSTAGTAFKSSTNVKKGSSSLSLRKVSYVLSAGEADVLNGITTSSHRTTNHAGSAMKMPPPPPRTAMQSTLNAHTEDIIASSSDLLARLYATAKQLDTDDPGYQVAPRSRRERSVSDTEFFDCKTASAIASTANTSMATVNLDIDTRRMRSASCGTRPEAANSTSPSLQCETILEEES
jgi:hypothetical protein